MRKNTYYDNYEDSEEEDDIWNASYCCCHCQNCSYWDDFFGCNQGLDRYDFGNYNEFCDYGDLW